MQRMEMKNSRLLTPPAAARCGAVAALSVVLGAFGSAQDAQSPTLYVFFTPEDRLTADLQIRGVKIVPQLLLTETQRLGTQVFLDSLKRLEAALGPENLSLAVWNPEGVALARKFAIHATPAFVLIGPRGHVHIAHGEQAELRELFKCRN
jgi:hypothetical protein